jgi:PiT family inorganic phosphate transporter
MEEFSAPLWVMAVSALAIGLGTVFGGWNVITKMAKGITRIRPYQGFCASTAGGLVISALTLSGIPTSSTHIISGSIVGVGATRGKNSVDWKVVRDIVTTWIVTFPLAVSASAGLYTLYRFVLLIAHVSLGQMS